MLFYLFCCVANQTLYGNISCQLAQMQAENLHESNTNKRKKEELRPKIKATSVAHMVWIRKVWHGAVKLYFRNYAKLCQPKICNVMSNNTDSLWMMATEIQSSAQNKPQTQTRLLPRGHHKESRRGKEITQTFHLTSAKTAVSVITCRSVHVVI